MRIELDRGMSSLSLSRAALPHGPGPRLTCATDIQRLPLAWPGVPQDFDTYGSIASPRGSAAAASAASALSRPRSTKMVSAARRS